MDAHALLTSQGWRGTGHSLHPTNDSTGLRRPLLVSRKDNTLGVGKKAHRTSDMWWLNAFDSSLKGLDTSKQGTVVQTITSGGLDMVKMGGSKFVGTAAGGGLYASFVRGEPLTGTIEEKRAGKEVGSEDEEEREEKSERRKKSERGEKETKEERRARKERKRAARRSVAAKESSTDLEEDTKDSETKEERRERRRQKKLAKEAEKNYIEVSSRKAEKQKRKELKAKGKDKSKKA
jgi:nucleolar protein TMA23